MHGHFIRSRARLAPQGLAIVFWAVLGPVCAIADTTLAGRVFDPQGKVVAGANLRLMRLRASSSINTQTDQQGVYQFSSVAPAEYRLTAEAPGFTSVSAMLTVSANQTSTIDLRFVEISAQRQNVV